jgi:hypothetical protein
MKKQNLETIISLLTISISSVILGISIAILILNLGGKL